jgi:hypothetical protein
MPGGREDTHLLNEMKSTEITLPALRFLVGEARCTFSEPGGIARMSQHVKA